MTKYVPVKRTFTEFALEQEGGEEDFEHWARYIRRKDPPGWDALLEVPMVVVLGEARSGKTEEFRQQARRLRAEGKAAFFLRLDVLAEAEFDDCLDVPAEAFHAWLTGCEQGYFFLDSVDEARLVKPALLHVALGRARRALAPAFKRAHVLVSSRISDWMSRSVREALAELAAAQRRASAPPSRSASGETVHLDVAETASGDAAPDAYQINPLDREGFVAIAEGLGAKRPEALWAAVVEGGYEAYARRPGDLAWMVLRWNAAGALGSFTDLTEAAVSHRLTEVNENYVAAGAALDTARLRQAVEALAAASLFSGRTQFQLSDGPPDPALIQVNDVLPDLAPSEQLRVLGSAVFDTASFGRVRFHHRTVREYLAAGWMAREIGAGLPVDRAIAFFVREPFGKPVLLKSRRGALCWFAVKSLPVRDYVVRNFPEMVMFEGDPTRWEPSEVVEAFEGYLAKLAAGFWQDWWNDATEIARVANAVPPATLVAAITRYRAAPSALGKLFNIVAHGKVAQCADAVYEIYRDVALPAGTRTFALSTLEGIATPAQREAIKEDIVRGRLRDNDARAAALEAVGLDALSDAELVALFQAAEASESTEALPRGITYDLLPQTSLAQAMRLLRALYDAVPAHDRRELGTQHGEERKPFAWMLDIYGEVFKRVISLLPPGVAPSANLIECAVFAERLHHTQFMDRDDFTELRPLIAANPLLRKAVALAVGLDHPNTRVHSNLTGFDAALIVLDKPDLEWVTHEAMQPHASADERRVWFLAAMDLTYATYRCRRRREEFAKLATGPDAAARAARISEDRTKAASEFASRRRYRRKDRERKGREAAERQKRANKLRAHLAQIEAGTELGAMIDLVDIARHHGSSFEEVDPSLVAGDVGEDLAAAFASGLTRFYRVTEPPDLMEWITKQAVPWPGLIGMASANYALRAGLHAAGAGEPEALRAIRFAPWSHDAPNAWVTEVAERYAGAAAAVLMPVYEAELAQPGDAHYARVLTFAMKSPPSLRAIFLDRALELLQAGRVPAVAQQRTLCFELREHPGAAPVIATVARARLADATAATPPTLPAHWLSEWLRHDPPGAWAWLKGLKPVPFSDDKALATALAGAGGRFEDWATSVATTAENVLALKEMFRFVEASFPFAAREGPFPEDAGTQFLNSIPGVLQSFGTPAAHAALRELAEDHAGTHVGDWLAGLAEGLAATYADQQAVIAPADLRHIHDIFTRDARTESELLDQVLARLEEVRAQIEKGPYGNRGLFAPGMDETKLQIYIADKLNDVPGRRFLARHRVSRESEVDLGNKPDLEVTAAAGRVPVEVKPVDRTRSYSAKSLAADTLRDQIAVKYLQRGGARHAAFVVMSLESKAWEIPDGPRRGDFSDLIAYLRAAAEKVRATHAAVDRIEVIGIDCMPPAITDQVAKLSSKK